MDLTIAELKVHALNVPIDIELGAVRAHMSISCVLTEVVTKSGIVGHGMTSITDEEPVAAALREVVAPNIVGLSALDRERIAEELYWILTPRGQTGYATHAISAVDLALWDILGKATGMSCRQLLGGARKDVPLYVTFGFGGFDREQLGEAARTLRADGVDRFKMVVGHHALAKRNRGAEIAAILKEDVARVSLVREAIGQESELYIDANCSLDPVSARWLAEALRELGITFFEEPLRDNDPHQMREFRHRTGIKVAAGQNEGQAWRFASLIENGSVDILQPNAVICGGFTGATKVAALAAARNVALANGGAFPFHNAHLHSGLANGGLVEWHLAAVEMCRTLFVGLPERQDWSLDVGDRPGLGFEIDHDAVAELASRPSSKGYGKG